MANVALQLPCIDLSGYLKPQTQEDRERVISQVRDACRTFGFFQLTGHGIPVEQQRALFQGMARFFNLPEEEKLKYSYLKNRCRRGYEACGTSLRDTDKIADAKECFYLGREDAEIGHMGFHGPNNWPQIRSEDFRDPVWSYYEATSDLGRTIWEILLQGLGHPTSSMASFAQKPMVPMKLLRYPPPADTKPGQLGTAAHCDFGGVTLLLQQPGYEGLEIWMEESETWLEVPAVEDTYVVNCGDMIQRWTNGQYKSVLHRVVNKSDAARLSCALFWHGDLMATNPLMPEDTDKSTVGELFMKRFQNQMHIPKIANELFTAKAGA